MGTDLGLSFLAPIAEDQKMEIADAQEARAKALAPAVLLHQVATSRMLDAQAGQMEQKADVDRKVAAALLGQAAGPNSTLPENADGTSPPISAQILNVAKLVAAAGDPIRAEGMMAQASAAAAHEATVQGATSAAKARATASRVKVGEILSNAAYGVTDQASWDAMNDSVKLVTGQDSPLYGMPYDPAMVKALQGAGIKAKDQAKLELDQQKHDDLQELRSAKLGIDEAKLSLARSKLQLQQQRAAATKKVGGKDVGSPAGPEVKAATGLLKGMGLVNEDDLGTAAYDVAAQARAFRKANPGISADDALRQAIETKRLAGDFESSIEAPTKIPGTNVDIPFTGGKKTLKYDVKQKPVDITPAMKPSDLVVGKTYRQGGVVGIWNGKGWTKPPSGAPVKAGGKAAPVDAAPDDGEDEE